MPSNTFLDKPFPEWGLEEARQALAAEIDDTEGLDTEGYESNRLYVEERDHWQDGKTWVGPDGGSEAVRAKVLTAVRRQFTAVDLINDCLDRMANGLMKREADIDFVPLEPAGEDGEPSEGQAARAKQMKAWVSAWWDQVKFWQLAREAAKRSRWAGHGAIRVWLPPGNREAVNRGEDIELRLPTGLPFEEALDRLKLSAPEPAAAGVYTDPDNQDDVGIYLFQDEDEERKQRAELWYIDGEDSVLRIVGDSDDAEEFRVRLGKRIPIVEMEADLLIDESVRQQQARLNFAESLLVRVAETGGFPERYTLNAQPHGIWLQSPPAQGPPLQTQEIEGQLWYLHPAPRTLGSSVTTDLRGIRTNEETGQIATPGVIFKEPTDPEFAIKSARHGRATILESCKQAHILIAEDATASGWSREQARADFEDDLRNVQGPLEGMLRDLIAVVIAFAGAMSREEQDFLAQFRVVVTLHIDTGPISPEEREQNNKDVQAGTMSTATAMAASGIEDVDAEQQKIAGQPNSLVELRNKQVTGIVSLMAAEDGMTWTRAAKILGVTDEELLAEFAAADQERDAARQQAGAEDDEIDDILNRSAAA